MEGEDCGGYPSCSWRVPGSGLGGVGVPEALGLVWLSRCLPVCVWRASCWAGSWGEACLGTVRAWLAAGSCGGQQTPCARGGGNGQTAAGLWEGRPRLVLPAGSAPQETSDKSVIELQQFARKNKPNLHILSKLQEEMRRLAEERVGGGPGPRGL